VTQEGWGRTVATVTATYDLRMTIEQRTKTETLFKSMSSELWRHQGELNNTRGHNPEDLNLSLEARIT